MVNRSKLYFFSLFGAGIMINQILQIKDVNLEYYSINPIYIFKNLELNVFERELIGIMGPSGSGKTSLFRLIMGYILPSNGKIEMTEKPTLIPQMPILNPYLTVEEILQLEFLNDKKNLEIEELLNQFDLTNVKNQLFETLSGGQKQRVVLLTKIASNHKFILADEPFNSMDKKTSEITRDLFFEQLKKHKITAILTSHNPMHLETMNKIYKIENHKLVQC